MTLMVDPMILKKIRVFNHNNNNNLKVKLFRNGENNNNMEYETITLITANSTREPFHHSKNKNNKTMK